jgi:hypothetical protein
MIKISSIYKAFAIVFIVLDLSIILYALSFEDKYWLLNSQVAFISSLFISITSFLSYKRNVSSRLETIDSKLKASSDERDKIDEIDDPFDLYSEYEEVKEEELTPEKIKEIIKEEKSKVKRNSFKNTLFSIGGFVSIYRIVGYGFLILGFFALNNNNLFLALPFIVGLTIVPFGILLSKAFFKA